MVLTLGSDVASAGCSSVYLGGNDPPRAGRVRELLTTPVAWDFATEPFPKLFFLNVRCLTNPK